MTMAPGMILLATPLAMLSALVAALSGASWAMVATSYFGACLLCFTVMLVWAVAREMFIPHQDRVFATLNDEGSGP